MLLEKALPSTRLWGRIMQCVFCFLPRKRLTQIRHIVVVHHLLFGDTLLLTPLLAKLRAYYPDASITFFVRPSLLGLYAGKPYGVKAMAYDPKDAGFLWRARKEGEYDLALVPGDGRFAALARALGAKQIIAHQTSKKRIFCADRVVNFPNAPMAMGEIFASLLPGPFPALYSPSDWPAPICPSYKRPAKPYAVLHLGASTPLKYWQPANWHDLACDLIDKGLQPIWSCGKGQEALVKQVDPCQQFMSYAGCLDVSQLFDLLKGAALLVCPDTSIAHLGRIVGVPTAALFGPGNAYLHGPGVFWQNALFEAVTLDRFPCRNQTLLFGNSLPWVQRCGRGVRQCASPRCMQSIDKKSVLDAIDKLLSFPM